MGQNFEIDGTTRPRRSGTAAGLLLSSALVAGLGAMPARAAVAAETIGFTIPAEPLPKALAAFGRQSGLQISYQSAIAEGLKSPGIVGKASTKDALARLLSGSGLVFAFTDGGTVVISRPAPSPADAAYRADASVTLDTINVQGAAPTPHPYGYGPGDRVSDPQQVASGSKTGTKLADIPGSVQIIPHTVLAEQGDTMLRQSLTNASGVNVGGQDTKGFYDHFLVRGLNAQIYEDGFSDGDQLGGISHSLNGVNHIEVVEGPGSALFGSGPPGGTINIVHDRPTSDFHYGGSLQGGSFGTIVANAFVTGATDIPGLNARVDGTVSHADGFRDLRNHDYEIRPSFEYQWNGHTTDFAIDVRQISETPDSYGIIYFNGSPLKSAPITGKYSTPFAYSHETYVRPTLTDQWNVNDLLTVNNRLSYLYRTLDILGNGDSTSTKVTGNEVVGRQLRQQDDTVDDVDYQFEPVWHFATGPIDHTLLTGFEYQHQRLATDRTTADLPNIVDAFNPVPPETSLLGINFLCDAKHSCDNDRLHADYTSVYATDQMDIGNLKIRGGVRQDWFDTSLTPLITVPGRFGTAGQPLLAGVTDSRNDAPVSWNVGALYKLFPWMSPYVGVSRSNLANFNSENTQNGIGAPESALQYEAGIKFDFFDDRVVLNTAVFDVSRNNVATLTTINGIETVVFDSQKTQGVEASIDTKITDDWHLLANVTAQNPFITSNPQGITSVGKRPQGAPTMIANLWSTYNFSIAGIPGFHVGAGLNYQSRSYSDITNVNSIPAYVIGNAAIGYDAKTWGIDVNVHNITDERYYIAANAAGALVGEPLSAMVNVHASF